jgi:hypothetical protein
MFSLIFIEKDEEIEMKEMTDEQENLIKQQPPEYEPYMVSFCIFL